MAVPGERVELKTYLSNDVDGAHDDLVQVPVCHEIYVVSERVLETRPHFTSQILLNLQTVTQVS